MTSRARSVLRAAILGLAAIGWSRAVSAAPTPDTPRLTILHDFAGHAEGNGRDVGLAAGPPGVVYGVSASGGTLFACSGFGCGNVFRLTKPTVPGAGWAFEALYAFAPGAGGNLPVGNTPAIGPDGTLYGTASAGGPLNGGVVWSLGPPAVPGGAWRYTVLHAFDPAQSAAGVHPKFGVVRDDLGVLYGLAEGRGDRNREPTGVVFALTPPSTPGAPWAETVLHEINSVATPGGRLSLSASLTLSRDQDDIFGAYGINATSGTSVSRVFRLHRGAAGWVASTLHEFPLFGDFTTLLVDGKRDVFGTFRQGGTVLNQFGTIFELSPPATGRTGWSERTLLSYDYNAVVYGNLAQDAQGTLFGTIGLNYGEPPDAIFRLDPPAGSATGSGGGGWTYSLLHTFDGLGLHSPIVPTSLVRAPGGNLFGVTLYGGPNQRGTVFRQEIVDHAGR